MSISELAHISTLSEEELAESADEEVLNAEETDEEENEVRDYMPQGMQKEAEKIKRLVHSEPSFRVDARPDEQTMYEFMLYHSYMNVMGMISIALGLGAVVMVVIGILQGYSTIQIVLFAAIAVMFIANSPVTLKRRARKQSEMLSDPKNMITYTFSDEGFDMARGENEYADFAWDRIFKVKEGKHGFYIYLERNRAFVIPSSALYDVSAFKALLKRHVTKRLFFAGEDR